MSFFQLVLKERVSVKVWIFFGFNFNISFIIIINQLGGRNIFIYGMFIYMIEKYMIRIDVVF